MTQTSIRASPVTHKLIVPIRALTPAITQLVPVDADSGERALIQPKAADTVAVLLIFTIDTVRKPIAPGIHRETV